MLHHNINWHVAVVGNQSTPEKVWQRTLRSNHQIRFFHSCDELIRHIDLDPEIHRESHPHLFILDWDGSDGHACRFLRHLRRVHDNGSAVLAVVDESKPDEAVEACQAGANEFITRPIDQFELSTRVVNLLSYQPRNLSMPEHYPPFKFDINRRIVGYKNETIRPRPREFDLMLYFFRRPHEIIPRNTLVERIWYGRSEHCRSVDTYISRVRRLYGLNGDSGWMIKSIYGKGYSLTLADQPVTSV